MARGKYFPVKTVTVQATFDVDISSYGDLLSQEDVLLIQVDSQSLALAIVGSRNDILKEQHDAIHVIVPSYRPIYYPTMTTKITGWVLK